MKIVPQVAGGFIVRVGGRRQVNIAPLWQKNMMIPRQLRNVMVVVVVCVCVCVCGRERDWVESND